MIEPKLRLKQYKDSLTPCRIGDIYTERKEHGDDSLPMLTVSIHSGVSDGELEDDDLGKRVSRSEDKTKYKRAEADDIVFNMMRAWQGAIGVDRTTGMVSPAYIVATPNNSVYPFFMDFYMKTAKMIKKIDRLSYGLMDFRKRLYWDSFITIDCLLPSIAEQKDIVSVFDAINNLIKTIQTDIHLWEEKKKGIIQKIFSQEVRFKDENGEDYPKWEERILSELLVEYHEKCPNDGTYEHVSLTKEGVVPKTEKYDRDFLVKDDDKSYRITHINDICYNPANLKFGVICRNKYKDAIFSPIYITFKVTSNALPEFMEMLLTRPDFINHALKFQEGTVYERMAVSPDDFLNIRVSIPCNAEQKIIADCLSAIDDVITIKKQKLEIWQTIKKGLHQQMFV